VAEPHLVRAPTEYERALFRKLLESDFPGRDVIKQQLEVCQVSAIFDDGTLRIHTPIREKAPVRFRVPVDASGNDTKDGLSIQVLLHVVDGIVDELEILKMGSDSPPNMPAVEDFEVIIYPIKG
jgi:hypothetical protein